MSSLLREGDSQYTGFVCEWGGVFDPPRHGSRIALAPLADSPIFATIARVT